MKIVIDNNVLISAALLKQSVPFFTVEKATKNHDILRSPNTLKEFIDTLSRPKFDKYFEDSSIKEDFILSFLAASRNIEVVHNVSACRDPKDNKYLDLALSGKADLIITGDADLLVLHPFRNISIISPKDFLDNYK
ncbi:MAG: putative toxin-antitoxin system toxin component, PIN family [Bacteroidales bacterium]|nr:putative toxin-antitoxin system toxin component, PIN family [Bacteroidales bacterium]